MSHVRVSSEGEVAVVTIDRPERRNALAADTAREVAEAIEQAGSQARAVILTGAGGAFCAGGDLDELEAWSDRSPDYIAETLYGTFQGMIRNIRGADAVIIAAVDGPAVGAGMDLALACDLRVASERARFGQVWVRLGVIPGTGGAYLTPSTIGPTRAAEMLLTGRLVDAPTALEYGIVNRVVPPGELMEAAHALAAEILEHPRAGVIANKRALVQAQEAALEDALLHAAKVQGERFTSDEFRAAVRRAKAK
jgi:2-(1,2-epoxy-1,2-dihydrophenyl)acetyl-CoA isomerase